MSLGDSLERYLHALHVIMERQGLATVRKVPTPVKVTNARGAMVHGRKLPSEWTDYAGTLASGRSVVFEAKEVGHTQKPTFQFSRLEDPRGAGEDQIAVLARHASFGALTFVYVRHHTDPWRFRDYVLPVDQCGRVAGKDNDSSKRGSRSIRFEDAELYLVPPNGDWLDVAKNFE